MDQKICLDTDISIEILKETSKGKRFLDLIEESHVFITSISVFELFQRETNLDVAERLLFRLNALDFNELAAKKASEIFKNLRHQGKPIEIRDLFIASIAIVNNCTLATLNRKHFKNIKGLKLLDF